MPKNKKQGIIFGIIMSYAMAYGMEVYNVAIKQGVNLTVGGFSNMTNLIFSPICGETGQEPHLPPDTAILPGTTLTYASFFARRVPLLLCARP